MQRAGEWWGRPHLQLKEKALDNSVGLLLAGAAGEAGDAARYVVLRRLAGVWGIAGCQQGRQHAVKGG